MYASGLRTSRSPLLPVKFILARPNGRVRTLRGVALGTYAPFAQVARETVFNSLNLNLIENPRLRPMTLSVIGSGDFQTNRVFLHFPYLIYRNVPARGHLTIYISILPLYP